MHAKASRVSCLNVNRGFTFVATGALHFVSASMMNLASKGVYTLICPSLPHALRRGPTLLPCVVIGGRELAGSHRLQQRAHLGSALAPKACFEARLRGCPGLKPGPQAVLAGLGQVKLLCSAIGCGPFNSDQPVPF